MKKKLLICAAFVVVCMSAQSQNALKAGSANQPKRLTTAEANALNGTPQPTIDGKPYSQYKAEQDALKNQQNRQVAVVAPMLPTAPTVAKTTAVESDANAEKTTVQSHQFVDAQQNGVSSTKVVKQPTEARTAEE